MRCRRRKTSEREERVRVLLSDGVVRDGLTAETIESRGTEGLSGEVKWPRHAGTAPWPRGWAAPKP